MFVRRKGAGVDVEVGIDFDRRNAKAARLENRSDAARDDAFANSADHATRDEYVLHRFEEKSRRKREPREKGRAGEDVLYTIYSLISKARPGYLAGSFNLVRRFEHTCYPFDIAPK